MKMVRLAALAAGCLALGSCFFAPGKFDSTLELRRDGRFSFAYTGEVLFLDPDKIDGRARAEAGEKCFGPPSGATGASSSRQTLPRVVVAPPPPRPPVPPLPSSARNPVPAPPSDADDMADIVDPGEFRERPCTPAETAENAARAERDRRQKNEVMGAVIGFNPDDPASIQAYVAELKRYRGWRNVVHRGGNRFDVDYRIEGTLGADYVFPVFDRVIVHTPFITVRPRNDGSAEVRAPGFGANGLGNALGLNPLTAAAMTGGMREQNNPFFEALKATDGTFTLVTDGEIRTNNTAEGPAARGGDKVLSWRVTATSREAPRALVALR